MEPVRRYRGANAMPSRIAPGILRPILVGGALVGRRAFEGGAATAALGVGLHFFIATTAAAVFVLSSTRIALFVRRPVLGGMIYGPGVFIFMQYLVVPLSAAGGRPLAWPYVINGILIHAVGVGLPIALAAARWHRTRTRTRNENLGP